ncbi:MAG TPA: HAMP domain-containing sensor histidine kinase, partial [Polyangia bacterium]|nr:HAMP domain-containing sensor histidine kinase [Polyangia bacterium]
DVELNGRAADDDARIISRRRRESLRAAAALVATSVALTAFVAYLVYRLAAQHDALQRAHANMLRETNSELEIFASRLSHDIMSPLASTRFAIEAALKAEDDETIQRTLRRGLQGLERAKRIAHALLEFARAGARPSSTERGDVRCVVAEVVDEFQVLAEETGARLGASVPEPGVVACDEGLLTAALSNLVRNALIYLHDAPEKRVDILAVDAGDLVRIEVRDTGPGLPPGTESAVFEPYVRGPGATQPGLGLGLATVKRIVEAHRGAVGVDSHPGFGSRFWIELPKVAAA